MATKHVICNLNLNGNQIENVVAEVLASAPQSAITGQFYYDSTEGKIGYYDGTNWVYTGSGNVYDIDTLDDDTTNGIYKLYYGSTAGTEGTSPKTTFKFRALKSISDYITLDTDTESSKEFITINLEDLAISKVTGLQTALDNKLDDSQLSTSTTLIDSGESAALDTKIPSQLAVKTYIDNEINDIETQIAGGMHFIGTWDGTKTIAQNAAATGQVITRLRKGDYWVVDVAATHSQIPSGGVESSNPDGGLVAGDMIVAISDVASISSATATDFKVVDNSEADDLVRLDSTQTLTNKTMSGSSNTFSDIPESAVTNLVTDLAAKVDKTSITTTDTLNTVTTDNANKKTVPSDYTVGKVLETMQSNAVHQYKQSVNSGTSVTINAATHTCGTFPEVKVYQLSGESNVEVATSVVLNASGDVTVSWNTEATSATAITVVVIGSTNLS